MPQYKLFLFALMIGCLTFAQQTYNYTGIVKDKKTNTPLADALVIVKPLRTKGGGYYSGVKTKDDGQFDLTTSYRLPLNVIVTRKGCTSDNIKIKKVNESIVIFLECEDETIEVIIEENKDDDNDGVINKNDECPDTKGPAENKGCPLPDNDIDGIPNDSDACPDVKGPAENNGCPYPDRDQDNIPDAQDNCPDIAGSIENNGCPDSKKKMTNLLNENPFVFFGLDQTALSTKSKAFLDQIVKFLKQSKSLKIEIIGYASSEGASSYNQILSEKRAQSVSDYLSKSGVYVAQLTTSGKGEKQPLESNATEEVRSKNRRVEIKF